MVENGGKKLPIENDTSLLTEYGRAFAWINLVEGLLEHVIYLKAGLNRADTKVINKLMNSKTLGMKIELASDLIDSNKIRKLRELNKFRIELSHSITAEQRSLGNATESTGTYILIHKKETIPLTIDYIRNITELSRDIVSDLHSSFTKSN
jgi:hypothetical protein